MHSDTGNAFQMPFFSKIPQTKHCEGANVLTIAMAQGCICCFLWDFQGLFLHSVFNIGMYELDQSGKAHSVLIFKRGITTKSQPLLGWVP